MGPLRIRLVPDEQPESPSHYLPADAIKTSAEKLQAAFNLIGGLFARRDFQSVAHLPSPGGRFATSNPIELHLDVVGLQILSPLDPKIW